MSSRISQAFRKHLTSLSNKINDFSEVLEIEKNYLIEYFDQKIENVAKYSKKQNEKKSYEQIVKKLRAINPQI